MAKWVVTEVLDNNYSKIEFCELHSEKGKIVSRLKKTYLSGTNTLLKVENACLAGTEILKGAY